MSLSPRRIVELATTVAQHTQQIDSYLAEKGLPYPSFEANGPADLSLPPHIEQSRTVALQASQELNDLFQGPRDLLFNHEVRLSTNDGAQIAANATITQCVPTDGEITFTDLAAIIGIDRAALCSILRLGIAHRVFKEPRPGVIAHSAASRQIAEDARVASWVGANVDDMWPAAEKVVDALVKWPLAAEPNQTGFSLANGTDQSFYAELAKNPDRARRFAGAMSFFTTGEGYSLRHLTDGYCWDSIGAGTVIDLGGSHGDAAFALARKYPSLHLIVQELPQVVAESKEEVGLDVKFMTHDLFEEQPVQDADVYLYRWTLHNWPDKYCIRALKALIPALKPGSRVLIMDFVMPPPGVLPNNVERKLRAMDITMLEIGNAKERDIDEWQSLFEQADPRFHFKGAKQPPGSILSILEATWEGFTPPLSITYHETCSIFFSQRPISSETHPYIRRTSTRFSLHMKIALFTKQVGFDVEEQQFVVHTHVGAGLLRLHNLLLRYFCSCLRRLSEFEFLRQQGHAFPSPLYTLRRMELAPTPASVSRSCSDPFFARHRSCLVLAQKIACLSDPRLYKI
ncbi:hypothetical protein DTO282F9_7368 [Paecilomyces variotii]|nr:hypothetical protein DTO282E5_7978 [Paecilomyces variotii]KAJ9395748.1 hypothetical protein DTO282F9_7368 [Paecilomyces variotii]